jgi:hypothetical protein
MENFKLNMVVKIKNDVLDKYHLQYPHFLGEIFSPILFNHGEIKAIAKGRKLLLYIKDRLSLCVARRIAKDPKYKSSTDHLFYFNRVAKPKKDDEYISGSWHNGENATDYIWISFDDVEKVIFTPKMMKSNSIIDRLEE